MPIKKYYQNPKVTDQVEFDLFMPDANGCFNIDPFKIDNIKIYFVIRNLNNLNNQITLTDSYNIEQQKLYYEAVQIACNYPTQENLINAQKIKNTLNAGTVLNPNYYSEANIIFNKGSGSDPLWIRTGLNINSILNKINEPDRPIQYGYFKFIWTPGIIREGDFYICYTYTPNMSGSSISNYIHFYIQSNIANDVANPAHITKPEKYITLQDSYLPEMYKYQYAKNDLTIETITKLNESIASGFTEIENLSNQLIDIIDANATQEPLLGYLSNFFGNRLRSTDLTLWRKQIKKAIPLAKMKGTLKGLEEGLMDAGIRLLKFTQFWQTGTDYVYTESFEFTNSYEFPLKKVSLPINSTYFSLDYRVKNAEYSTINLSNIDINTNQTNGVSVMTWTGNPLNVGDYIKLTYQVKSFLISEEILIYQYIKSLPLADTRNDRNFYYPPKDWNTKLIAKDDIFFDFIINTKNPFVPELYFGKIRTSFPYSENVYNMEEYNGSLRDSQVPCDIDKSFIDPCRSSISSYYMLDVDINDLSNVRLQECQEVVADYTPFHAILHTLNFSGYFEDFVLPPIEEVEILIRYIQEESVIAGMAQTVFNRAMLLGLSENAILRDSLATKTEIISGTTTGYNDLVNLYCPNINFEKIGLSSSSANTFLEILDPSFYYDIEGYTVETPNKNNIKIIESLSEPLNTSQFSFRLSNIIFADTGFSIDQTNEYTIVDSSFDLSFYDIKSIWDVENGYATSPWKLKIISTNFTYDIKSFTNNIVELLDDGTLGNTESNVEYVILNENDAEIYTSTEGYYKVKKLGKVTVPMSLNIENVKNVIKPNAYFYRDSDNTQYAFYSYVKEDSQSFLISDWDGGMVSDSGKILQRLVDEDIGMVSYQGMKLVKQITWPTFNIPTYNVDNQNFKENYILLVDGSNYYFEDYVVDANGHLHIGGKFLDLGITTGTILTYTLYQFSKETTTLFDAELIDVSRNGQEIINKTIEYASSMMSKQYSKNNARNGPSEDTGVTESLTYKIEYRNGQSETGELQ